MKNPKRKGSSFERQVAVAISLALSGGKKDDLVWRTASSGARYTQRAKKGKGNSSSAGDVEGTTAESKKILRHYIIECKHYQSINLGEWLTSRGKGQVGGWLDKLCKSGEAEAKNRIAPQIKEESESGSGGDTTAPKEDTKAPKEDTKAPKISFERDPVVPVLVFRANNRPVQCIVCLPNDGPPFFGKRFVLMTFLEFLALIKTPPVNVLQHKGFVEICFR